MLLRLAHRVIHRCATGRVFVAGVVTALRRTGLAIAVFAVVDLILGNLMSVLPAMTGDLATWQADFALGLPMMAVGMLVVVMAAAMRMALRLHQDQALTI